jgi:long-chain acyl-CoA synthetase
LREVLATGNLGRVNLAAIIEAHPKSAPAVLDVDGQVLTYGELRAQVGGLRGALAEAGVSPGDRVVLIAGNDHTFVLGLLAILGVGGVAVPLNPTSPAAELTREIGVVRPVAAIVGAGAKCPARGAPPVVITADDKGTKKESITLSDALAHAPAPLVDTANDSLAVLIFTSGTAGLPRAAQLTHGNVLANIAQLQAHPGRTVAAGDVAFGVLPLFHVFGLTVSLCLTFAAGGSILLVPRFDPVQALELCARHGVTLMAGAPTMFAQLASAPATDGSNPLAAVRLAASGAAPLPAEVAHAFRTRFGIPLYEGYGLTEASPVVTSSVLDGDPRPGSVGVPLPGVDIRLIDASGDEALEGDVGELWVRGANVFPGYWEDADATARAVTADGWLRTGDLAVIGDDGQLQLVDRAKDLIIVHGFNVVPAEVEAVLAEHPGIVDAAVVGVPSERTGEAVRAVVVAAEGVTLTLDDVAAFCSERLARYKCPTELSVVPTIPHGQTGKLLRRSV